jgi:predicted enzyme related to lactoylglutathione lyase
VLGDKMVSATLPATDLKRAKDFYTKKLGLKASMEDPGGFMIEAGKGTGLYIYKRGPTKADQTAASFAVSNIEAEVKELTGKGIKFEEYDMPDMGLKTVNGIATMGKTKGAWFKDSEGNILALTQMG